MNTDSPAAPTPDEGKSTETVSTQTNDPTPLTPSSGPAAVKGLARVVFITHAGSLAMLECLADAHAKGDTAAFSHCLDALQQSHLNGITQMAQALDLQPKDCFTYFLDCVTANALPTDQPPT